LTAFIGGRFHGRSDLKRLGDALDFAPIDLGAKVTEKHPRFLCGVCSLCRTELIFSAAMEASQKALAAKGGVILRAAFLPRKRLSASPG